MQFPRSRYLCLSGLPLILLVGGLVLPAVPADESKVQVGRVVKIQKSVIPVFTRDAPPLLAAVIRVDQAGVVPRRLGFFQISVAPKFVVEGVHVSIKKPGCIPDLLRELTGRLNRLAGTMSWEIRRLSISVDATGSGGLEAQRAWLDRPAESLSLILEHASCGRSLSADRARLTLGGTPPELNVSLNQNHQVIVYHLLSDSVSSSPSH